MFAISQGKTSTVRHLEADSNLALNEGFCLTCLASSLSANRLDAPETTANKPLSSLLNLKERRINQNLAFLWRNKYLNVLHVT